MRLPNLTCGTQEVLLPRTDVASEDAAKDLTALGALVDQPVAYRTLVPEGSREKARHELSHGKIDIATFTSSSTVQNLVKLLDGDKSLLDGPTIACIGPVTAQTARNLGLKVDVVAARHTVKGLVQALKDHLKVDSEA